MRRSLNFEKVMGAVLGAALIICAAKPSLALAPQQSTEAGLAQAPLSEKQVIDLVKHNKKDLAKVEPVLKAQGVDFEVTPAIEKALRKAGATDELMAEIQKLTPSARASGTPGQAAAAVNPQAQQEKTDFQALERATDPDQAIKLATAFEQKYPNSPFMSFVYSFEANAYQQKNDAAHTVEYAEKSLQLRPNNLLSLMIASSILPTPQIVENLSDADKAKKLDEAEADANRALQIINQLPQLPKETDAAYQARKKAVSSGVYSALGMVHLERAEMGLEGPDAAELAKAQQDYTTAVQNAPKPNAADYYRLAEVYTSLGKVDEAIDAYNKASAASPPGSPIPSMAQQQIQELKKNKPAAGAPAPAKP